MKPTTPEPWPSGIAWLVKAEFWATAGAAQRARARARTFFIM